jgi:phosphoribosyl-ATP pyrophosphohydrolase/phosphoribosyl-AMP cyclohydrolase
MTVAIDEIRFDEEGLVPAVVQDSDSGAVLMVAYMNRESLARTIETREVHFWSRSRNKLWKKGETSGNVLRLRSIRVDCDADCLLVRAEPAGPACHTGERSCFFEELDSGVRSENGSPTELGDVLGRLARTIRERHRDRPQGSYTSELFERGLDRIAQKVGEEATEVVISAVKEETLAEESADLLYHLLVLWQAAGLEPRDVAAALARREKPGGKP